MYGQVLCSQAQRTSHKSLAREGRDTRELQGIGSSYRLSRRIRERDRFRRFFAGDLYEKNLMKQFTNLAYLCSVKNEIFITGDEIVNSFIAISLSKKNYYCQKLYLLDYLSLNNFLLLF